MAKRTRTSARGKPASKKDGARSRKAARKTAEQKSAQRSAGQKTVQGHSIAPKNAIVIRRLIFTPAALAYARHRYEKTEASLADIAVDLRVAKNTVRNLAKSEGWTRYAPPARNLPPGVNLMVQASNVEAQTSGVAVASSPVFADSARTDEDAIQSKSESRISIPAQLCPAIRHRCTPLPRGLERARLGRESARTAQTRTAEPAGCRAHRTDPVQPHRNASKIAAPAMRRSPIRTT